MIFDYVALRRVVLQKIDEYLTKTNSDPKDKGHIRALNMKRYLERNPQNEHLVAALMALAHSSSKRLFNGIAESFFSHATLFGSTLASRLNDSPVLVKQATSKAVDIVTQNANTPSDGLAFAINSVELFRTLLFHGAAKIDFSEPQIWQLVDKLDNLIVTTSRYLSEDKATGELSIPIKAGLLSHVRRWAGTFFNNAPKSDCGKDADTVTEMADTARTNSV